MTTLGTRGRTEPANQAGRKQRRETNGDDGLLLQLKSRHREKRVYVSVMEKDKIDCMEEESGGCWRAVGAKSVTGCAPGPRGVGSDPDGSAGGAVRLDQTAQ